MTPNHQKQHTTVDCKREAASCRRIVNRLRIASLRAQGRSWKANLYKRYWRNANPVAIRSKRAAHTASLFRDNLASRNFEASHCRGRIHRPTVICATRLIVPSRRPENHRQSGTARDSVQRFANAARRFSVVGCRAATASRLAPSWAKRRSPTSGTVRRRLVFVPRSGFPVPFARSALGCSSAVVVFRVSTSSARTAEIPSDANRSGSRV